MGCWFANNCMCLWGYFPVLWRLTRIRDAIWITMECSCLDIDINLLEKCAGKRIKIDVKVSHFGLNSRKCNISSPVPNWPTYFGAGITWHDPNQNNNMVTSSHGLKYYLKPIRSRSKAKLTKLNKNKLSSHKSKSVYQLLFCFVAVLLHAYVCVYKIIHSYPHLSFTDTM